MSLDLLGADFLGAGEGLGTKYITLRVKRIDARKLREKLGGMTGQSLPLVLPLIDRAPEVALQTALPLVAKKALDEYGVELDWQVTDAPPLPGQAPPSNFGPGVAVGVVAVGAGWLLWRLLGL